MPKAIRFFVPLLIMFYVCSTLALSTSAANGQSTDWWPMEGHDSDHTGFSTSAGPNTNEILWTLNRTGVVYSQAISDDVLVSIRNDPDNPVLFAQDATSGRQLWSISISANVPCISNRHVIFGSSTGMQAVDLFTGAPVWNDSDYGGYVDWPVATGGKVFAVKEGDNSSLMALNEIDGKEVWRVDSTGIFERLAADGNAVYVGYQDQISYATVLCAYDVATGKLVWKTPVNGDLTGAPCVADNKVYAAVNPQPPYSAQNSARLCAFDAASGKPLWNFTANPRNWVFTPSQSDNIFSAPSFDSGRVYVGVQVGDVSQIDDYGTLFSIDANTGAQVWNCTAGLEVSIPAIADGKVYVTSSSQLQTFNESTGKLIWRYAANSGDTSVSTPPIVADGRVFTSIGGQVFCFGSMVYSALTISPIFYDNFGHQISPSSWLLKLPNGTTLKESSNYYLFGQLGNYSIAGAIVDGATVFPRETTSFFLAEDSTWNPNVNCTLPTQIYFSLGGSPKVGLAVNITGNLICNQLGVSEAPVIISYSVTFGKSWSDITEVETGENGEVSALWLIPATGTYLVKANWEGNDTFPAAFSTVNFGVIEAADSVLSVTSNSNVSAPSFDPNSREFTFVTTGQDGSMGYADVSVPKTLSTNTDQIKLLKDCQETGFSTQEFGNAWILHFVYHQSSHNFKVLLNSTSTFSPSTTMTVAIALTIALPSLTIVVLALAVKRKTNTRKRMIP